MFIHKTMRGQYSLYHLYSLSAWKLRDAFFNIHFINHREVLYIIQSWFNILVFNRNLSLDLNRCWTEASVVQNDISPHNLNQKISIISSWEITLMVVNHEDKRTWILVYSPLLYVFEYRQRCLFGKSGQSCWTQHWGSRVMFCELYDIKDKLILCVHSQEKSHSLFCAVCN